MFSASALLLVLQHFCYVGNTFVTWADTSLLRTVPYLRVPIVLCSSHSLLPIYAGKYLYLVYMNNMIHEIKSTQFCSVVYTGKQLYDKNMNYEQ